MIQHGLNHDSQPRLNMRVTSSEMKFKCKYCGKQFVREHHYMAHKCKEMKRDEELRTPNGQTALTYYQLWMRTMKRNAPSAAAFVTSRYYQTFMNFVVFSKSVDLPKPDKFIWLMVQKNYPPTIWTTDDAYVMYLEFLDRKTSPMEQASLSIETLIKTADRCEVELSEVFSVLNIQDLIHMLRTRRLSAWLLLFSKKFQHMYKTDATLEQRLIIDNLVRPEYWEEKITDHMDDVKTIKMLISEMGI
jgi:hypothetical protein